MFSFSKDICIEITGLVRNKICKYRPEDDNENKNQSKFVNAVSFVQLIDIMTSIVTLEEIWMVKPCSLFTSGVCYINKKFTKIWRTNKAYQFNGSSYFSVNCDLFDDMTSLMSLKKKRQRA